MSQSRALTTDQIADFIKRAKTYLGKREKYLNSPNKYLAVSQIKSALVDYQKDIHNPDKLAQLTLSVKYAHHHFSVKAGGGIAQLLGTNKSRSLIQEIYNALKINPKESKLTPAEQRVITSQCDMTARRLKNLEKLIDTLDEAIRIASIKEKELKASSDKFNKVEYKAFSVSMDLAIKQLRSLQKGFLEIANNSDPIERGIEQQIANLNINLSWIKREIDPFSKRMHPGAVSETVRFLESILLPKLAAAAAVKSQIVSEVLIEKSRFEKVKICNQLSILLKDVMSDLSLTGDFFLEKARGYVATLFQPAPSYEPAIGKSEANMYVYLILSSIQDILKSKIDEASKLQQLFYVALYLKQHEKTAIETNSSDDGILAVQYCVETILKLVNEYEYEKYPREFVDVLQSVDQNNKQSVEKILSSAIKEMKWSSQPRKNSKDKEELEKELEFARKHSPAIMANFQEGVQLLQKECDALKEKLKACEEARLARESQKERQLAQLTDSNINAERKASISQAIEALDKELAPLASEKKRIIEELRLRDEALTSKKEALREESDRVSSLELRLRLMDQMLEAQASEQEKRRSAMVHREPFYKLYQQLGRFDERMKVVMRDRERRASLPK